MYFNFSSFEKIGMHQDINVLFSHKFKHAIGQRFHYLLLSNFCHPFNSIYIFFFSFRPNWEGKKHNHKKSCKEKMAANIYHSYYVKLVYFFIVLYSLVASSSVALPTNPSSNSPPPPSRSRALKSPPAYRNQIVSSRAGKYVSSFSNSICSFYLSRIPYIRLNVSPHTFPQSYFFMHCDFQINST